MRMALWQVQWLERNELESGEVRERDAQQGAEGCWGEIKMAWQCQGGGNPAGPQGQTTAVSKPVSTGATVAGPAPGTLRSSQGSGWELLPACVSKAAAACRADSA